MIDMTNFKKSVKWYDENLATLLPGEFIVHRCLPLEEDVGFHCHTDNVFRNPVPLGMIYPVKGEAETK